MQMVQRMASGPQRLTYSVCALIRVDSNNARWVPVSEAWIRAVRKRSRRIQTIAPNYRVLAIARAK
jgi:hypothetical protein